MEVFKTQCCVVFQSLILSWMSFLFGPGVQKQIKIGKSSMSRLLTGYTKVATSKIRCLVTLAWQRPYQRVAYKLVDRINPGCSQTVTDDKVWDVQLIRTSMFILHNCLNFELHNVALKAFQIYTNQFSLKMP